MRLFKRFKKVLPSGQKGQVLVETALSLPVIFLFCTAATDFIGMTYTQHRVTAAAYEGTKIISQLSGNFTLDCFEVPKPPSNNEGEKADPPRPNRCPEVLRRTEEALRNSGLDPSAGQRTIQFKRVDENGVPSTSLSDAYTMAGVFIEYPYVHTFGSVLSFSVKKLKAEVYTHLDEEPKATNP